MRFENLRRLEGKQPVSLPTDSEGMVARKCPSPRCRKDFKVKPGTGLRVYHCTCPYCGHKASSDKFSTPDQKKYAKAVVATKVHEALELDVRKLNQEFRRKARGAFGLGITASLRGPKPRLPGLQFRALETHSTCEQCKLTFAIFGLYAYCPDCGTHNSLQVLRENLNTCVRQVELADTLPSDDPLKKQLTENALEDCVSAFDGWGRQLMERYASKATNSHAASRLSFQRLPSCFDQLWRLFAVDSAALVNDEQLAFLKRCFQQRHVIAHRSGVVDSEYLDKAGDLTAQLGHRVKVRSQDVISACRELTEIAKSLEHTLSKSNAASK